MIDAHCHVVGDADCHFICSPSPLITPSSLINDPSFGRAEARPSHSFFFLGTHPWDAAKFDAEALRQTLAANPRIGVGEIGLDRLKEREISATMRETFAAQLEIAAEFSRPVVLHGAKCWGEVVKAAQSFAGRIPAFLFHGFSRSDGLLSDIAAMNGFISICPAILNDHAVNYRRLAARIPNNLLLIETDRTPENAAVTPSIHDVAAKLAKMRGISMDSLCAILDRNAGRFVEAIRGK